MEGRCSSGLSGLHYAFLGCGWKLRCWYPLPEAFRSQKNQTPLPAGEALIPGQGCSWELCALTASQPLSTTYDSLTPKCRSVRSAFSELYPCSGSDRLLRQVIPYMCHWLYEIVPTIPLCVFETIKDTRLFRYWINKLLVFFSGLL